jgi:hypothetical protein
MLHKPPQARRADTTSAGVEGPGSKALQTARGPEGRHTLDLDGRQNLVTLGCVSPSGLAVHRGFQPVVTTTGRGYASPSGLRKAQRPQFGFKPKCRSGKTIVSQYASSDCSLCSWDHPEHRLKSQQDLRVASPSERQAVPCRPSVQPRSPSVHHNQSGHHIPSVHHSSVAPKWANKHRVESVQNGTFPNCRTSIARRSCTYRIRRARAG